MLRVLVPRRISPHRPDGDAALLRFTGRSMGCEWSVCAATAAGTDRARLAAGTSATLDGVVRQMSTWESDSAIARFNRAPAGSWLPLPAEFATVLACALRVADASAGALDPTAGGLVTLWGFGATGRHHQAGFAPPGADALDAARRLCDWQRLEVDAEAGRIYQPGGVQLDLSAVAKGFGVDEVCRYLGSQGIDHCLVDVGGELRGAGVKPDGQPWWVEVQEAVAAATAPLRIALHDLAVATSGAGLQHYRHAGRRYSHCIDPRSGHPIDNGVTSVTVLHDQCMEADAWSTALMVLGVPQGLALAERHGLAARLLVRSGDGVAEHLTGAFRELLVPPRRP